MCHRHAHSRLRVRKQLCHSTVTLEARSSSFMADGRETERSALVISNAQLQYLFFFFLKRNILISPFHSVPTLLSIALCIPLHSGLPMVLRLMQMFPCVCSPKWLCRETLSFMSPTSPLFANLHHHVWPCLQSVPHTGPSDTTFPSLTS